ncbi:helix-turn-helix domain-containing protein [Paenibacillus sp. GYB003]|uniref:helix-turn-helix domain-containing protein n=1 Tax=Paenibacillus sp. GYB003 TaxID=2994392 RepID=UPI002F963A0C
MNPCPLSDCVPQLNHTIFWKSKQKFQYYEDSYEEWMVFAVEDGSFYYEIEGESGTAAFGDWIVCPPRTPFRRVVVTPLSFYALRLFWHDRDGNRIEPAEGREYVTGKISIKNTSRLAANYAMMKKAESLDHKRKLQLHNHYAQDIWLLYCAESGEEPWAQSRSEPNSPDPVMSKASALIRKHAFQTIDLKQIAASLELSPARLTQKFKSEFGVTPIHYLTSIRLEKAKRLLLDTNLTLEQISESIGYQNGYYLNRIFLKHMNVTPAKYRKANRV